MARVVLISLNYQPYFDKTHDLFLSKLRSKANLQRSETKDAAVNLLSEQPQPCAVLITDEALTKSVNADIWDAVLQYVRQGGTCVVMGHFSSFVEPLKIKPFFAKAGLEWEQGSYHRTTLTLNREAVGDELAAKLSPQYSQKAVFLKNIASEDAWYQTDEGSVTESHVFAATSANIRGETAVALTRVGDGKLGYIGDVNAETESDAVILAMCGLSE